MFRRSFALAATAAAVFVASAGAGPPPLIQPVTGHVRVEGRFHTIFGSADPHVRAVTALAALQAASRSGEFYLHVAETSYGPYVDQIGLYAAFGSNGWTYKVNGVSPPVGADQYVLKPGDHVLWYWALFGPHGGPRTLLLQHLRQSCYRVWEQDDAGHKTPAKGAVLHVDGHRLPTHSAHACTGPHHGLVRATLRSDVRSNEVR